MEDILKEKKVMQNKDIPLGGKSQLDFAKGYANSMFPNFYPNRRLPIVNSVAMIHNFLSLVLIANTIRKLLINQFSLYGTLRMLICHSGKCTCEHLI